MTDITHVSDMLVGLRNLGVTLREIIDGIEETRFYGPWLAVFNLRAKRLFHCDNLLYCFTLADLRLQSFNVIHFHVVWM